MLTRGTSQRGGRAGSGRIAVATVATIVVALLASGVQHSLRLCGASGHRAGSHAVAVPGGCPEHASKPALPAQPQGSGVPPCCAPVATLVSIPSARGAAEEDVAPALRLSAGAWPVALHARAPLASRTEAREALARPAVRFAHLRPHLALRVILA